MKPPPFEYYAPKTVKEAVGLLQQNEGDAKVLAGGQSLMPVLNMRLARPAVIVDLNRTDGLSYIREENGTLAIGALTRQREMERSNAVKSRNPLLHAATLFIGHPQIRNRGTVGGSIAHADPAAEDPAAAVALGAEMVVSGPEGDRTIPAEDFFVTALTTSLEPAEILKEIRFPALPTGAGWSFIEVARRHGDFALAGAAVTLSLSDGVCSQANVVVFGVAPVPLRVTAAERLLAGEKPSDKLFEAAGQKASEAIEEPMEDIHASAEFRRHLAGVMAKRALAEAAARAKA